MNEWSFELLSVDEGGRAPIDTILHKQPHQLGKTKSPTTGFGPMYVRNCMKSRKCDSHVTLFSRNHHVKGHMTLTSHSLAVT